MARVVAAAAEWTFHGTGGAAERSEKLARTDETPRWIERTAFEIELLDRLQRRSSLETGDRVVTRTRACISRPGRTSGRPAIDGVADPVCRCVDLHAPDADAPDIVGGRKAVHAYQGFALVARNIKRRATAAADRRRLIG